MASPKSGFLFDKKNCEDALRRIMSNWFLLDHLLPSSDQLTSLVIVNVTSTCSWLNKILVTLLLDTLHGLRVLGLDTTNRDVV